MTGPRLSPEALRALSSAVRGTVIGPEDALYDDARRVWNAMIDRHPAVVVRAGDVADVAPCLEFAGRHGLPVALRGGGHSVAGYGTVDDGLVLDLGSCRDVTVDVDTGTATVAPGATLADLDRATTAHGLAVPIGVVSATGVAGLTLGGGFGWLTRKHGLTVDNLLAADVVTADGRTVHASAEENPDLLWGLTGGGGNFGAVTSFTFAAHPLPPTVLGGNLIYFRPRWEGALRAFADWTRDLPDEMTAILTALTPPPDWDLGADPMLVIGFAWAGAEHGEGLDHADELAGMAPPDAEEVGPTAWPEWQSAMDGLFPKGVRAYWKNSGVLRLDDEVIAVLCARAEQQTWQGTAFDLHHMGGAFRRVDPRATAFPDRSPEYWLNVYGFWASAADDERNIAFVRGLARDVEPFSGGAQYVNFMAREPEGPSSGPDEGDLWRRAATLYGEEKLDRLAALKRWYDPQNVFRLNHNIPPLRVGA
ncbi:FAD-binding oxidoreductase [Micrococcus sp. TA1]|uniref:FAD-binding oxidoreductase n=1 Tax=Micrococcus sp. TA1 TaxID=681627 RepID=UPI00161ADFAF|nr:FAD-binding oxidoreductase [Micrococcus sp. TA1]MBB5747728.1 FAD/FMN-containing dehydrogenase [Micrococcus sp. TA1]